MRVNIYCIHNLFNYNIINIVKDNKNNKTYDMFDTNKELLLLIYNL